MCGVSGIVGESFSAIDVLTQKIHLMGKWQIHRGPDEWGEWIQSGIGLGHNRLSILDIKGGKQPMVSSDGTIVVVFNGEIYNFQELRSELQAKGHKFQTDHSDTEVIVYGYKEWSTDVFNHLEGMFAVGIWDNKKKSLFLARDRIGIKPLYYSLLNNKGILFSSEPKAIIGSGLITPAFNEKPLADFFMFRAPKDPDTFFKGIHKLPPGSFCSFNFTDGFIAPIRFWLPQSTKIDNRSSDTIISDCQNIIESAVITHLVSDVPVGVFLSGGVDSSLLSIYIKKKMLIESFVVGTDSKFDETPYAKKVADSLGILINIEMVDAQGFIQNFDKWIYYNDDPVSDPSALALFLVSRLAQSKGMKVMICGEGSDELFAGYLSYVQYLLFNYIAKVPGMGRFGKIITPFFGRHTSDYLGNINNLAFMGTAHTLSINDLYNLIKKDHHYLVDNLVKSGFSQPSMNSPLRSALLFDQKVRLPNDILPRTDRATMAHSLEARVPFLDRKVIEFANNLPDNLCIRLRFGQTKWILKKILSKYFPIQFVFRKKRGFDLPIRQWLLKDYKQIVMQFIEEEKISQLNYSFIKKTYTESEEGSQKFIPLLWSWFVLENWYRMWIINTSLSKKSLISHSNKYSL